MGWHIVLSLSEDDSNLQILPPDRRHSPQLGLGLVLIGLDEDRPDARCHHWLGCLGHLGQEVHREVLAASLPRRAHQGLRDGLLEADVGVADRQLDPP